MNISTELLIGIVLIGMGLLLGTAAYMVLSGRSSDEADSQEDGQDDDSKADEDLDPPALEDTDSGDSPAEAVPVQDEIEDDDLEKTPIAESSSEEEPEIMEALEPDPQVDALPESESTPDLDAPEIEITPPKPESGPRIQVATLLRDEVSGELIIEVGDREYRSAAELRDSQDWIRVEYAASDLSKWIEMPLRRPTPERELEAGEPAKPMSMIEQINEILQKKVAESGQSQLAVRLMEGPEGSARVLIGVHSYELGEVPDEAISDLIREAVADWEAGQ